MRRAATLFFLTGLVSASWAARIPAIQEQLQLSAGELGVAVLGLEAGAIAGLPAGGALIARRGSRTALRAGFAVYPLTLPAVALAPGLATLAASLAAMAFANSLVDVAVNVRGVELERRRGVPVLARLHAGHAFGVLAAGLGGTAAAAAGLAVAAHFALVAGGALLVAQVAAGSLAHEPAAGRRPGLALPGSRLALLGALAFCAFLLDGAAFAWIAVQLRTALDASPAVAAAGFTAFAVALALGRLASDRLVARRGRIATVRAAAALATAGIAAALLAPGPGVAVAGWAAFGAGLAPIAPAVLGAAAGAPALAPAVGIAAVTTVGYLGSFTGPPLIGALAGPLGLSAALGLMLVAAVSAGLLARPALARAA
jgi:MFS family permease